MEPRNNKTNYAMLECGITLTPVNLLAWFFGNAFPSLLRSLFVMLLIIMVYEVLSISNLKRDIV
jgi:L-lactate permease